ncbi:AraC family transcriptional regulator with amidase-like domain [Lentzea atacamensis]|uniref:AraC family transcriptional regulator with amidase-like domain n=1 Tax=Lentzea atacamensis TaxID=531938 RepID=A0ABX9E5U4_9PSEU|nr:helix-turn-helix domain-containing protein [Lentzea atacamensis]RAS64745.1 AraC family transcriptional regulator with amidase-like domain [Lentzea atacamensis]
MAHRIAVLALETSIAFDFGTATHIFSALPDDYELLVCSPDRRPVRTTGGYTMTFDHGLEVLRDADTVLVPGTRYPPARQEGRLEPAVHEALTTTKASRIMSICTGAFVLGAAGILDGRPATTHWSATESFRALYPKVELNPDVLFVDDGDVLTSAGVAAGIDLCLHVIRSDHGSEIANQVARYCVVPAWRQGGQSQFVHRPVPDDPDSSTAPARAWALDRLDEPLELSALAEQARMSVRTFTRRFRAETGMSPGRWLTQQRVERARYLLESTDLPIDQVARHAGFGTGAALRQQLAASIGVSPTAYRQTFRTA